MAGLVDIVLGAGGWVLGFFWLIATVLLAMELRDAKEREMRATELYVMCEKDIEKKFDNIMSVLRRHSEWIAGMRGTLSDLADAVEKLRKEKCKVYEVVRDDQP